MKHDPRITPWRDGVAARSLEGVLEAEIYLDPKAAGCAAAGAGWMTAAHLCPIGVFEDDWAGVAERFLGAPYLWGGRESLGLDCSGLVQQALFACGRACPRDTDQQEALGVAIAAADFGRGD